MTSFVLISEALSSVVNRQRKLLSVLHSPTHFLVCRHG